MLRQELVAVFDLLAGLKLPFRIGVDAPTGPIESPRYRWWAIVDCENGPKMKRVLEIAETHDFTAKPVDGGIELTK